MIITPIKTDAIRVGMYTLEKFLDSFVPQIHEHDIVVVTSKVVSLCEGRTVDPNISTKDELVTKEADYYLSRFTNPWHVLISINKNTLIASAGIDESNGDGNLVLWPKDIQKSTNVIRTYLCNKYGLNEIGVIVTDSHLIPLRWGTVGTALAHSGFVALNSYIGEPDLFGRKLKMTFSNISEGLAAAAVVCMGEGNESTPIAVISEVPFVQFQNGNPSDEELAKLAISKEEDIFAPLLNAVSWETKK